MMISGHKSVLLQGLPDTRRWIGLSAAATGSWDAAVAAMAASQVPDCSNHGQLCSTSPSRLAGFGKDDVHIRVDDASVTHVHAVLLGLTDDMDAAVVRIGISAEGAISADHVASVPALAYVVAGKVQRRAVLFGQPGTTLLPPAACYGTFETEGGRMSAMADGSES